MEEQAKRMREKHAGKVPCIVDIEDVQLKFIVAPDICMAEMMTYIRGQLRKKTKDKTSSTAAYFLVTEDAKMASGTTTIGQLDADNPRPYIKLIASRETVFG
jgi:hypothetical protein